MVWTDLRNLKIFWLTGKARKIKKRQNGSASQLLKRYCFIEMKLSGTATNFVYYVFKLRYKWIWEERKFHRTESFWLTGKARKIKKRQNGSASQLLKRYCFIEMKLSGTATNFVYYVFKLRYKWIWEERKFHRTESFTAAFPYCLSFFHHRKDHSHIQGYLFEVFNYTSWLIHFLKR